MSTISLRMPEKLNKSLSIVAKKLEYSKSHILKEALKKYLTEVLEDIEDSEIALARSKNPNRKVYTSEEFAKLVEERHVQSNLGRKSMNKLQSEVTAFDVANYFLSIPEYEDLTNLKLQKLVYYAQGIHLAIYGKPLFNEAIKAWEHGPVVPELYRKNNSITIPSITPLTFIFAY